LIYFIICIPFTTAISIVCPILAAKQIIYINGSIFKSLIAVSLIILFFELIANLIRYISRITINLFFRESLRKMQTTSLASLLHIKNKSLDAIPSGVIIERVNNDCNKISNCVPIIVEDLAQIITNLGIITTVFFLNKIIFAYLFIAAVTIFMFKRKRIKKWFEYDVVRRKAAERRTSFISEMIRGIRDIKVLNSSKSFLNEADNRIVDYNNVAYKMQKTLSNYDLIIASLHDIFNLIFIFIGIYLFKHNLINLTVFITTFYYKSRIYELFTAYSALQESLKDLELSSTRVLDIIEGDKYERESFGERKLKKINGNFEFKHVSFNYKDDIPVLKDLSFKVDANTTVAFVGKSGTGKTTIFNILAKLYDINSGEVLIDGINIDEFDEDTLRGNMTIINQSPYIFNMSIYENLKIVAPKATKKDIVTACKTANLHDYIMSLPEGYETMVGEGGITLSGGQKQRLAIARALIQKTEIIMFDEATSALDNETQEEIQKAIDNMKNEYTILIIAHRFSTVINSSKIYFIEDGKVSAEGTHEELLKKSKGYKELYELELKKNI